MEKKKIKIFVAMSGGVDSSVAAALLKKRGFDIVGVYMKGWSLTGCTEEDSADARRVAGQLGIPFYVFDFEEDYKKSVVDYMVKEYAAGRTPNPDVMCNREIKFGLFLKRALALGADFIATGHYVRKVSNKLFIAKDKNKDQSYFLWTLIQNQFNRCSFPIGDYIKPQVRVLAKKMGLATAEKPDSQGVCFVGEIDVAEFLKSRLGKNLGPILTLSGEKVGTHDGLSFYTIGQRKGIGTIGGGVPYYIVEKDFKTNTLFVAEANDEKLFGKTLKASAASWISGKAPKFPLVCLARIRYRQPLQLCKVVKFSSDKISVNFNQPQRAITPGQSVVFYTEASEMLGGAVIDKAS